MVYKFTKPREILFSIILFTAAYYLVTSPESMVSDGYGWFKTFMFSLFAVFAVLHAVQGLTVEKRWFGKLLKVSLAAASGLFLVAAAYTALLSL